MDFSLFTFPFSLIIYNYSTFIHYSILISPRVPVATYGTTTAPSILTFMAAMPSYL